MRRPARAFILAGAALVLLAGGLTLVASPARAQTRRSGTVVSVDPQARSFVFTELAEEGRPRTFRVQTDTGTRITLAERTGEMDRPFKESPIGIGDLRAGDFVVVELPADGGASAVKSVTVTLREGSR